MLLVLLNTYIHILKSQLFIKFLTDAMFQVTVQFVSPPNNQPAGGSGDTMKGFKISYRQLPCSS